MLMVLNLADFLFLSFIIFLVILKSISVDVNVQVLSPALCGEFIFAFLAQVEQADCVPWHAKLPCCS